MDRRTEKKLFEIFRRAYNAREEVSLSPEWRKSLMRRIGDLAREPVGFPNLNSWLFGITYRLGMGLAAALVLAFLTFAVAQYQFNLEMVSLAFGIEQDINIAI
jgi:hypothetical protein